MRDSVPSASYSSVCNVLRQWNILLIPTYRVYRLYDIYICMNIYAYMCVQTRAEVSVHYRQAMKHFRSLHQLSFEGSANLDLFILLYTEVWGTMGYRGTSLPLSPPLPLPPSPPSLPPSLRLCVNRNSWIMEFEMSVLCTWLPYVYRDICGAACTVFAGI